MLSEPRTEDSVAEGNIGWYIGGDYEYAKRFDVPELYRDKKVLLEFESVYHNAEVFVNGEKAAFRPYGYTNFYVDPSPYLRYGQENEIRVIAHNAEQPNSRWYSGTGIYRPVYLYLADEAYIPVNGVRVQTVGIHPAVIEVTVRTSVPGKVSVEILREGESVLQTDADTSAVDAYAPVPAEFGNSAQTVSPAQSCDNVAAFRLEIPDAKPWSGDSPNLYTCKVSFADDVVEETFGVRELKWSAEEGMTINGERVILRGACIHHDNGILGACTFPEAEERKVRILKENGYNALRSAHYPCSKALLDACDKYGMLMMDEYVDHWYIHKTKYDYVLGLADWWQDDLREMVEKDFNHPSVIMYSTGNEVAETGEPKGIAFTGEMTQYLHSLDPTRPVTCGINIFFNFLYSIGLGVYSDDKAEKAEAAAAKPAKQKKKSVGSEFYNMLAVKVGDNFMKMGATLYPCDLKTRDAFANMDIAGYNYGIFRYRHDLKKYPKRLILGSETFCKDAYSFWEIAKKEKRIIGDFVWSGWDYLGETGDGAAEYSLYKGESPATRMTGGNGRIDLSGKPRAEAAYTRVAFEQEIGPWIAVEPVDAQERLAITGWQLTKALESWSWRGCDGKSARVEVYARAAEVELLVNDQSVGRRKVKRCRANFKIVYRSGEITAVAYDASGREIGRSSLKTAGKETQLRVKPESTKVKQDGLVFIPIQYTDEEGIWKPRERHQLAVSVQNGTLMGLGNAAPYYSGNYTDCKTETYFGEALAVVRASGGGPVKVTVSDGNNKTTVEIPCEA